MLFVPKYKFKKKSNFSPYRKAATESCRQITTKSNINHLRKMSIEELDSIIDSKEKENQYNLTNIITNKIKLTDINNNNKKHKTNLKRLQNITMKNYSSLSNFFEKSSKNNNNNINNTSNNNNFSSSFNESSQSVPTFNNIYTNSTSIGNIISKNESLFCSKSTQEYINSLEERIKN